MKRKQQKNYKARKVFVRKDSGDNLQAATFEVRPRLVLFLEQPQSIRPCSLRGFLRTYKKMFEVLENIPLKVSDVYYRKGRAMIRARFGCGRNFAELTLPAAAFCRRKR